MLDSTKVSIKVAASSSMDNSAFFMSEAVGDLGLLSKIDSFFILGLSDILLSVFCVVLTFGIHMLRFCQPKMATNATMNKIVIARMANSWSGCRHLLLARESALISIRVTSPYCST